MNTEEISKIFQTESSVPSSTSCTGSWPGFSRSPKHGSSVEMSAIDFLTSKTYILKRLCEEMKSYDSICDKIITMSSNTSFTGSWSGFSSSTELASSVCMSPLDPPPSKTYKWALKFEVFCVFLDKIRKTEKRHEILDRAMSRWRHHVKWWRHILTGLCQDDVTTSSGDVISRIKLHSHVRVKIVGKVT